MSNFTAPNNIFTNWNKDMYIAPKDGVEYDEYLNEKVKYAEPFYFGKVNHSLHDFSSWHLLYHLT